jgi:hypothetical protein
MLSVCSAISVTCWLCVLVAVPHRPLPGNEVQELVYARLLGRQQRLILLAFIASVAACFAVLARLPGVALPDSDGSVTGIGSSAQVVCRKTPEGEDCYRSRPDGSWNVVRWRADGSQVSEGFEDIVAAPPPDVRTAAP